MAEPISESISMESVTEETVAEPSAGGDVEMGAAPKVDRELDETELEAVRQVEFYFADSNLPYDKFMWTLHTADPNHWVKIDQVASFKRMQEYKSKGSAWLVEALRYSTELEVDAEGVNIRRRTEVKEPKGQFERSVYAKGFGEENDTLQKELEKFFRQYGNVNAVRMRRDDDKKFKGSVFCEFTDFGSVVAFLNANPKPTWNGKELEIYSKEDYVEKKIKEKGITGSAAAIRKKSMVRRGFDAFAEMRRSGTGATTSGAPKREVYLDLFGTRLTVNGTSVDDAHVDEEKIPKVEHTTLRFSGCGGKVEFNEIKAPLKDRFERSPFIKFSDGDDSGLVGFDRVLTDDDLTYIREKIPKLNESEVKWDFIEFEEERPFQVERAQSAAKRVFTIATKSTGRREEGGGRGRGRGRGRGGGRGEGRGRGRGGGRGRGRDATNGSSGDSKPVSKSATPGGGEQSGEKRKRAIEPDGGHDVGVRGAAVPSIASLATTKKQKVGDGDA